MAATDQRLIPLPLQLILGDMDVTPKTPTVAAIFGHACKLARSGHYNTSADVRAALEELYEPWRVRMSLRGRHKVLRGVINEAKEA